MVELERQLGYSFSAVERLGLSDPRYMSLERLERSNGTIQEVRQFLYSFAGFNELYYGDGNASPTAGGLRLLREYIMLNVPLERLGEYRLVDIPYGYHAGSTGESNYEPWWG